MDPSRKNSKYCINKIKIEKFIKKNSNNYLIFRFPEIIGKSDNPNTLTNFFFEKIKKQTYFEVYYNARRNLLDIDHAIKMAIYLIKKDKKNKVYNIINSNNTNPLEVVDCLENILKKKGKFKINYKKIKKFNIKCSLSKKMINELKIKFDKYYLLKTLKKYYK